MSVKWVKLELIDTLECFGVDLLECDSVLCPLEDVDLLHDVQPALSEVALPGDGHLGLVIPLGGLLVLCIGKNNKGDPQLEEFFFPSFIIKVLEAITLSISSLERLFKDL